MPVINIGLRFVTETEAHGQRRTDFPVITNESSQIELTCRKPWITGDDAELARAPTESPNLRGVESKFLEQHRPPIAFNRSDRRYDGLTCRVTNQLIVGIQKRRSPTSKSERAVKILRCNVVICLVAQPQTKAPTMPALEHAHVILKLVIALGVERMARRRRPTIERSEHLNCGTAGCGSDLVAGPGKLKAYFVHHIFREHRRLGGLNGMCGRRRMESP